MGNKKDKKSGPEKLVVRIGAFFAAILAVFSVLAIAYNFVPKFTSENTKTLLTTLNFAVLVTYYYFSIIRPIPSLQLNNTPKSKHRYCDLLNVKAYNDLEVDIREAEAEGKAKRVNRLIRQLHRNVKWYVIFLMIVYFIYAIDNKDLIDVHLFPRRNYYTTVHNYFNVVTGVCNYLSAVFLFLAFKVLYNKTLEDDNETPTPYYHGAVIFSIVVLLAYVVISDFNSKDSLEKNNPPAARTVDVIGNTVNDYGKANDKDASKAIDDIKEHIAIYENEINLINLNRLSLFIGIANGLAMALLFGRYLSMEQFAYNMKAGVYEEGNYGKIIHYSTIYILPIYAVVQPLFGSFDIDAFGDSLNFKNFVFAVCLIGKVLFLYLTYLFMKQRLMHLYLHSVITSHGVSEEIDYCFNWNFFKKNS